MSRTTPTILTNMCMIMNQQGFVVVQNRTNSDWPGITFPGGHIEPNESFSQSVTREIYEETGLTINNPKLCGIKDWSNHDGSRYIVFLYICTEFSGELVSSAEGEVFWTPLETVKSLNLSVDFDILLDVFINEKLSEFYYQFDGQTWLPQLL